MENLSYRGYYFTALSGDPPLISGCNLPSETTGIRFENCEFHPRLWEALQQMYSSCEFAGCNWRPAPRPS
jgi:hypothetical protein